MTNEEFVKSLGLAEDKAKSAADALKKFLDGSFVTKARFNEVNEAKKSAEAQVAERDKQLDALKKGSGDAEKLKEQITKLQAENKAAKAEAEAKIKDIQFTNAIKLAITNAQDVDLVAGLIDRQKLILGEDGKITGLKEQVEALSKNKPFLFKADNGGKGPQYKPNGGGGGGSVNPFAKESWNMTEQGRLFRENPENARAMAKAAGVEVAF